mgnify:CR=1 FL=1
MDEVDINSLIVSYQDVKDDKPLGKDDYDRIKSCLSSERINVFFSNPFLSDLSQGMLFLQRDGEVVVGHATFFPTNLKAGDVIENCSGGSNLYVVPQYRKYELGTDILLYPITDTKREFLIYADLSETALALYRILCFQDFSLKKYLQPRKSAVVFELKGCHGVLMKAFEKPLDWLLKTYRGIYSCLNFSSWKYNVKQVRQVPEWIDDIVLNDGHKYMEVHDHHWMQWCLDNMFLQKEGHKNSFFVIERGGEPFGFFFTKNRIHHLEKYHVSPKKFCSIMEWGSKDESVLGESEIYDLCMKTIDNDVDIVELATNDVKTEKKLKRQLFIQRGEHHVVFKDIHNKYKEAKDQTLWRIRFGYSDSIFN